MSILIKGMEMPTRCEDCFCFRHNAEYDYAYCNISSVNVLGRGNARLNNCPLLPVPSHGRLVDADALLKRNCINLMFEDPQERYESCDECLKDRGYCGLEIDAVNIVNAPTVIEGEKEKNDGNNN